MINKNRYGDKKVCRTCRIEKPIDRFYWTDRKRGFKKLDCDECDNKRRRQRYQDHRLDEIKRSSNYRRNNLARYAFYSRRWSKKNPKRRNEFWRNWWHKRKAKLATGLL